MFSNKWRNDPFHHAIFSVKCQQTCRKKQSLEQALVDNKNPGGGVLDNGNPGGVVLDNGNPGGGVVARGAVGQ